MNQLDRGLLRHRHGHEHHKVSAVELFFDLIFVFAVTQLSHSLLAHLTPIGAVETLLLLLGVWWVWVYTTWFTNWLDPEKMPVRVVLLVMMLLGLIVAASIPAAFGERGLAFAVAYVTMQVGRTAFFIWAVRGRPVMVRNFQRILVWLGAAGALWIAGGFAEGHARLALWSVALACEFVSPSLGFWVPGIGRSTTTDWDVEGGHMAERCGLFVIIALGESILVTGATFAQMAWTTPTVAAFLTSFVGSLAMWWLYFDTTAEAGTETIAHSADPGRLARLAYTYVHILLVAGIVVSAVGDELVLAHPDGHTSLGTIVIVIGGAALFLVGNMMFRWAIAQKRRPPWGPIAGLAVLAVLAAVGTSVTPLMLSMATAAVLIGTAAWEHRARKIYGDPPPRVS